MSYRFHVPVLPESPLITTLSTIGALWAGTQLYGLLSFAWNRFLRPSRFARYKGTRSGQPAWAVITGASDGIGKEFATEFSKQGLNVVLHGRNKTKLEVVKSQLERENPGRQYRILILDASRDGGDLSKLQSAASSLDDLNITVLVNNVADLGPIDPILQTIEELSPEVLRLQAQVNTDFALLLTKLLLPNLVRSEPALVFSIGSGSSEIPSPYNAAYGAAKAFLNSWSRSMQAEVYAAGHDIEVKSAITGMVTTERMTQIGRRVGFFTPSPAVFVRSCLNAVGSGEPVLYPYWPHALQFGSVVSLPMLVQTKVAVNVAQSFRKGGVKKA